MSIKPRKPQITCLRKSLLPSGATRGFVQHVGDFGDENALNTGMYKRRVSPCACVFALMSNNVSIQLGVTYRLKNEKAIALSVIVSNFIWLCKNFKRISTSYLKTFWLRNINIYKQEQQALHGAQNNKWSEMFNKSSKHFIKYLKVLFSLYLSFTIINTRIFISFALAMFMLFFWEEYFFNSNGFGIEKSALMFWRHAGVQLCTVCCPDFDN